MKPTAPNGRPPLTPAAEIVAAWKRTKSVAKICAQCHAGSERVVRILQAAGIAVIPRRYVPQGDGGPMPERYILAITAYQKGVATRDLKAEYGVSLTKLYWWMDKTGVVRRSQHAAKEWRCWHCGAPVGRGELFCGEQHRQAYRVATVGPNTPPIFTPRKKRLCQSTA